MAGQAPSQWTKFRSWIAGQSWVRFLGSAVVTGLIGWAVITLLDALVKSSEAHDIGVIVIGGLVVVAVGLLGFRFLALTPSPAQPSAGSVPSVDSGPWSPTVALRLQNFTADTPIRDALLQYDTSIPRQVMETTLGEMALLRRMFQVRRGTIYEPLTGDVFIPRTRCEDVLTAAGAEHPNHSIIRLIGAGLLYESDGNCRLTDGARRMLSDFTTYLTKDPLLVAAYRRVTPRINRTIMLDGRPLES